MNLLYKLHMLHRFWRYKTNTEKESVRFLLRQNISKTIAIDIGANRGIYTYFLSKKVGKQGKVLAFEPQPELIPQLELLKKSFGLGNVSIENKGLSNLNDHLNLYRVKIGCGGASFEIKHSNKLTIDVEVIQLDDYFKNKFTPSLPISFIKADIEGHELKAFMGAKETILKYKPILLFECHQAEADKGDLFSFLIGLGYRGFFFYHGKEIDCTQYNQYPYRKKIESHRNYIFVDEQQIYF